ncbi:MAG: GntR family transcriptional regulator [Planctomycetota bacterium]
MPPSVQLVDAVLDAVASGLLLAGDRLPSVRNAAVQALVNPNTVAKAWKELERLGVVVARNGSGVYVRAQGGGEAQELRRSATLTAFDRAAVEALRAGHGERELLDRLRGLVAEAQPAGGER